MNASDKTKVLTLLDAALAEGRITPAEHAERTQAANQAQTFDDLVPLTRDLVVVPGPAATPTWSSAPVGPDTGPEMIVAIFAAPLATACWQPRAQSQRADPVRRG